jgi:LmbE family N-acetylglucosaminyl deacetylase
VRIRVAGFVAAWLLLAGLLPGQQTRLIESGSGAIQESLERLNVLGSVMMIAAHPDDENNPVLVYFARGRKIETSYLSLTRGEGGQNLIGSEQSDELGVIRTQELQEAARIQGSTQWFTRAVDFGFSKTPEETIAKWDRETVLRDTVWVIRKLRPDVVILRFSGTPRDGHAHHQASNFIGKEAYAAAADPRKFPEQLKYVQPWQAKRLIFNMLTFFGGKQELEAEQTPGRIAMETGLYDPRLGFSYAELAGVSRSNHKTQGFGFAERKGAQRMYFQVLAGEPAKEDLFDGIDTSWARVRGGAPVGALIAKAIDQFNPRNPAAIAPVLVDARELAAKLDDPWARLKLKQIDEAIALCAGLWVDLNPAVEMATPGQAVSITANAIVRSTATVEWRGVRLSSGERADGAKLAFNQMAERKIEWTIPANEPLSQPYWLRAPKERQGAIYAITDQTLVGMAENAPVRTATFTFALNGKEFEIERPLRRRSVDRVQGELTRAFKVAPPVALKFTEDVLLYAKAAPRKVTVEARANRAGVTGMLKLKAPRGWKVDPAEQPVKIEAAGEQASYVFNVSPVDGAADATLEAVCTVGGQDFAAGMDTIRHSHIEPQTLFPAARARLVRVNVEVSAKRVGYITGAGDEVPAALKQLGVTVDLINEGALASADLAPYDALVVGVRAYSVRGDLKANHGKLMEYVSNGGTLITQYNIAEGLSFGSNRGDLERVGPYPLKISRDRVTVEEAPVEFLAKDHPLLQSPNRISASEFAGWVQERGLYFASEWDPKYTPLFSMNDPGEKPLQGGTLVARHGKGTYIYTSLAWFRQLPAGVPGAYRIFANFLSAKAVNGVR